MTRKEKYLTKVTRIQSTILMAITFMWLMPYGTFDPGQPGFYVCMFLAVVLDVVLYRYLRKFQKNEDVKE